MGRIVHLVATSLLLLVMISSNSPSCQACIGWWCLPCFKPSNRECTYMIVL
ncbi:hypothetical protein HU200_049144 [Digitaria exilis]|uniref:Uncharacterized protein n=1 Tax=Digitaria exilis TaxID=1010633 RepID=A0A835AWM2_9POAL|nr:hypothetical protein HU200_049144 [Digitaria exilis]